MIPGTCNTCGLTLTGNEVRGHMARCVEAVYGIRAGRATANGRRRLSLRTV